MKLLVSERSTYIQVRRRALWIWLLKTELLGIGFDIYTSISASESHLCWQELSDKAGTLNNRYHLQIEFGTIDTITTKSPKANKTQGSLHTISMLQRPLSSRTSGCAQLCLDCFSFSMKNPFYQNPQILPFPCSVKRLPEDKYFNCSHSSLRVLKKL